MDISVDKPAKAYLQNRFEHWYSEQVMKQLEDVEDIEEADI